MGNKQFTDHTNELSDDCSINIRLCQGAGKRPRRARHMRGTLYLHQKHQLDALARPNPAPSCHAPLYP